MEFVIDLLLNNALVQGLLAGLVGLMAWWGRGVLAKRQGRQEEREKQREADSEAAARVLRDAADAKRLRKPSGERRRS